MNTGNMTECLSTNSDGPGALKPPHYTQNDDKALAS